MEDTFEPAGEVSKAVSQRDENIAGLLLVFARGPICKSYQRVASASIKHGLTNPPCHHFSDVENGKDP